ncbi:hypothetical protein Dsin_010957 [Dipteronia sinensis]|uniref:Uncharacterized protein n=1 Tax=Dipteronia sinensis TaxID=43782 RepID=A0AAE0AUP1_9ROSI|nr:hypothetical protein Dsin_010957 [Dipteronia sinensis]
MGHILHALKFNRQLRQVDSKQDKIRMPSSVQTYPKNNFPNYPYHYKPFFDRFFPLEPTFLIDNYLKEPKKLADKVINPLFHRIPDDEEKTQPFYEFILVDTGSVAISEIYNKYDPTKVAVMKIKICKIITLEQWGGNPNKKIRFSRLFRSDYSYWDYRDAWFKMFYRQNPEYSLSWCVYFDKNFPLNLPFWFLEWWDKFGPTIDFLPCVIKEGFHYWSQNLDKPSDWEFFPDLFLFFKHFDLTWILMLEYNIRDILVGNIQIPYFGRQIKIKWWSRMKLTNLGKDRILKWFSENPSFFKNIDQLEFLLAKSQILDRVAAAKTPEELLKIMKECLTIMSKLRKIKMAS